MPADGDRSGKYPVGWALSVAALAAGWLFPGLGHVVLGRLLRGFLFAAIVMGSFALGMAHDGRLALRDGHQGFLTTLQVIANAAVGPADVVARFAVYGAPVYSVPEDPEGTVFEPRALKIFRERSRSGASSYGTAYLWTAGLMNILLLFDVFDIARGRKD